MKDILLPGNDQLSLRQAAEDVYSHRRKFKKTEKGVGEKENYVFITIHAYCLPNISFTYTNK